MGNRGKESIGTCELNERTVLTSVFFSLEHFQENSGSNFHVVALLLGTKLLNMHSSRPSWGLHDPLEIAMRHMWLCYQRHGAAMIPSNPVLTHHCRNKEPENHQSWIVIPVLNVWSNLTPVLGTYPDSSGWGRMAGGGEDKEGFLLPFNPEVIFHLLMSHPVGPGRSKEGRQRWAAHRTRHGSASHQD